MIHVSWGNMKLGAIPNVSLPPVQTCRQHAPCAKKCYALKAWRMYPSARRAWRANLREYRNDPQSYFRQLTYALKARAPRFFRWHASGDIPDAEYLKGMINLAKSCPQTRFLAFTKQYELVQGKRLPANLTVVLSAWPGLPLPSTTRPIAYMQDGTETRVPSNAIECPGNCETCGQCWSLPQIHRDVVFHAH